ncbi:MAG TPA: hypothetical protein VKU82_08265 [Planctomycetaceae bacterium]|nr:hypothetical protein [Planctomycetaceae bacterium]
MLTQKPAPISGVSAGRQALIMVVYPSIACTAIGKWLGRLYESIPLRVMGIKLSHLLFPLPTAIVAIQVYAHLKLFGEIYVLTNQSVQLRRSLGNKLIREVSLSNVDRVVVRQEPGQEYYPAADIYLVGKGGETLMSLPGVLRADVFRQSILEAKLARDQVAASLAMINARHAG